MIDNTPATPISQATQRVFLAARTLFLERGYAAVSMGDLASALKMQKSSLYYHVPDGKEALYVAVMSRFFAAYRQGMLSAVGSSTGPLEATLVHVGQYIIEGPVLNASRLFRTDFRMLSEKNQYYMVKQAYQAMHQPVEVAIARVMTPQLDLQLISVAFFNTVESLHEQAYYTQKEPQVLLAQTVRLFLSGIH